MPRPKKEIPLDDIKGLKTLVDDGLTQQEIADYYQKNGIKVNRATISRKIKEMEESENK